MDRDSTLFKFIVFLDFEIANIYVWWTIVYRDKQRPDRNMNWYYM